MMADEIKQTVKLRFAPGRPEAGKHAKTGDPLPPSPTLEINNGDYSRRFDSKDQPFEAEAIEEAPLLLRTGDFVLDEPKAKAQKPKAADTPSTVRASRGDREKAKAQKPKAADTGTLTPVPDSIV
jgi:hypothetical protein